MKGKKTDYSALDFEKLEKNMESNTNGPEENLAEEKKLEVDMKEFSNLEAQDKIEVNSKLHFIVMMALNRTFKVRVEDSLISKQVLKSICPK